MSRATVVKLTARTPQTRDDSIAVASEAASG